MGLFQLVLYIGLISILALGAHYMIRKALPNAWMSFLQYFTGFLFLVSGWVKAVDPLGTAYKMEQYFAEFEIAFEGSWMSFLAPVFPWLAGFSVAFSVFMIIFEIVLGVMVLIGAYPKWSAWAFFLLIIFFTVLTGFTYLTGYVPSGENFFNFGAWEAYTATNMRVTDCGCFGDFIKLEPKVSFFKDIVLLFPAILFLLFSRKMHQWFSKKVHLVVMGGLSALLLIYCLSNFLWDLPHVDFRPFKEGVNVAEKKQIEEDAMANVQVLAFRLQDTASGEIIDVPYADYLNGVSGTYSSEKYDVVDQVRSEPEVAETKISHFDFLDAEGNDMTEDFLYDEGNKLMLVGHKLKYDVTESLVTVIDSVFAYDTIPASAMDGDSVQVIRRLLRVDENEEKVYGYRFDEDFTREWKHAVELSDALAEKGVRVIALIGGAGQETLEAFNAEIGADFPLYEADDILLKTIIRSNPGYVAWKGGQILRKWHRSKVSPEELNKAFGL